MHSAFYGVIEVLTAELAPQSLPMAVQAVACMGCVLLQNLVAPYSSYVPNASKCGWAGWRCHHDMLHSRLGDLSVGMRIQGRM